MSFCRRNSWSDSAVAMIRAAETAARQRHCEYIGTEHLFLALVTEESAASALLKEHDETAQRKIVDSIERLLDTDLEPPAYLLDDLLLTPRTENAIKTATNLPVATVGCEHVLVALLFEPETVAHQILVNVGFTHNRLLAIANRFSGSNVDTET